MHTASGGRNEPLSNPQLCSRWIHSQSVGSLFLSLPGTRASCRVSTSRISKPSASRISCGAIQRTPVLSIATDSTWRSFSHWAIRISSEVVSPISNLSRRSLYRGGAHPVTLTPQINSCHLRTNLGQSAQQLSLFITNLSFAVLLHFASERHRPGWLSTESNLAECHGGRTNVQLPSWNHADSAAFARMKKGP